MNQDDKTLIELATVGAGIAFVKLLAGGESITWRLLFGRIIVGAGLSMAAGAIVAMIPHLPILALVGIGSAFGIAGQSFLEHLAQRWIDQRTSRDQ
jgi:hypothetical protein